MKRRARRALMAAGLACLQVACGGSAPPAPPPAPVWTDDGYVELRPYVLSYQAQRLQDLDPQVAQRYGLQRSASRGLLTLVLSRQPGAVPVAADFSAEIRTLTGELRATRLHRVEAAGTVSQLAEFAVSGREWLIFKVAADVPGGPRLEATFRREFFAD